MLSGDRSEGGDEQRQRLAPLLGADRQHERIAAQGGAHLRRREGGERWRGGRKAEMDRRDALGVEQLAHMACGVVGAGVHESAGHDRATQTFPGAAHDG